jgi:hypothetical protein
VCRVELRGHRIRACARRFQFKPMVESFTKLKARGRFLIFPYAIISPENNLKTKTRCLENKTPGLAIYIKKKYLKKAKEELWKIQIFHHAKMYLNLPHKKSSKRYQNPSRYHTSITNLKFQHKPKISYFENPHMKIIDLLPS